MHSDSFDPRVTNEFSSAAFRIGHTMIPDVIKMYNKKYVKREVDLKDVFNNPSLPRYEGQNHMLLSHFVEFISTFVFKLKVLKSSED